MLFAVVAALLSAACFAAGSALQHRVASASSADQESAGGFLARLVRRPSWLIGLGLSAVAFGLHALALSRGDLTVVQPVIVSGIVFAVLIRAGLDRRWPAGRTMVWLILTWAGLALFLLVRPDPKTDATHSALAWLFVLVGALAAVGAMLLARRTSDDRRRGLLLGCGAGLLFGLVAGLLKIVLGQLDQGWGQVFTHWSLYALLAVGAWAIVLNQRAYQATRISVTASALNITQVIVAITFGVLILGEHAGSSVGVVIGELIGLSLTILGVRNLAALPTDTDDAGPAEADADTAAVSAASGDRTPQQ